MHTTKNHCFGIFGLGITGKASYKFLKYNGYKIVCFDDNKNSIDNFINDYKDSDIVDLNNPIWTKVNEIIVSPGINPKHQIFHLADKYNIPIVSDIDLLYDYNKQAYFIGITGTNGKSTTTALTYHIIFNIRKDFGICGNIGVSALSDSNKSGYVMELSSYQIDLFKKAKLDVAVLLNITPDHLDRYKTLENYINSKLSVFLFLKKNGVALIGADNEVTANIIKNHNINTTIFTFSSRTIQKNGVAIIGNQIFDNTQKSLVIDIAPNDYMQGDHNIQNIAASYAICRILGIEPLKIVDGINSFKGLKHRMQYLGQVLGINFYNDSKATNIDAASKSISSLENIYWLAGGIAKEKGLRGLERYFPKIRKAYLFGQDKQLFADSLKGKVEFIILDDLKEAFNFATNDALKDTASVTKVVTGEFGESHLCSPTLVGSASSLLNSSGTNLIDFSRNNANKNILLAPAAASTDQFKNFEERGDRLIELYTNFKKTSL